MNAQTHYPLQRIQELEQENEELRHDIKRHIASMTVEAEANAVLRSRMNETQRELGRKDFEIQQLNEQLAKEVE